MVREFVMLPVFDKAWKDLKLTDDDDLKELQIDLCINPKKGEVVSGTGGLRKIRFALPGKGKSHGVRVVYIDFEDYEKTYLIGVYSKNAKLDLTEKEKKVIKKLIYTLKKDLKKGHYV